MSEAIVVESRSTANTLAIGAAVGLLCRARDVIALAGELGAGKTQFTRGLAQGMAIDPRHVSSPTFVIAHEYEPDDPQRPTLVHIDAYRLTSGDELASLGWAGAGGDLPDDAVLAIEWADRVTAVLPEDRLDVRLEHSKNGRRITLQPRGDWCARMIELRQTIAATATNHG